MTLTPEKKDEDVAQDIEGGAKRLVEALFEKVAVGKGFRRADELKQAKADALLAVDNNIGIAKDLNEKEKQELRDAINALTLDDINI